MISVTPKTISSAGSALLKEIQLKSSGFNKVRPPEVSDPLSLVFASTPEQLSDAIKFSAAGIIALDKLTPHLLEVSSPSVWTTPNIPLAMSLILPLFDEKQNYRPNDIHPTAIIHPSAKISETAKIGAYAIIEEGAEINDYCVIDHHVVIQAYAKVGPQSHLQPFVFVGAFCEIGQSCIISPHVTIGSDGFGYAAERSSAVKHHKIPQIGKVIIEDFCEFGTFCAIDRATLFETRIRKGTKFDNFCHVAHNCEIGENAMIAAGFMTAGSTKVGKNFLAAGSVNLNGHIHITDNVVLTARSGAISSIEKPGVYGGFPVESHKDNLRTMASLSQITTIRKQVQKILKHLKLTNEGEST